MKAALGQSNKGLSTQQLLERTGLKSIYQMALTATCGHAWKCGQNWEGHPLTMGRIKGHMSGRNTRQGTLRQHPPQSLPNSLIHRMVEVWEELPSNIKEEKEPLRAKKKNQNLGSD